MSIIRKVFIILLGVTLMFMNISGVKAQDDNTTTDFSNYITAASLDYKEGDKEIAYKTDTKLTEDTSLVFKLDADVPSSALSSDHKIDYQLPDNLNVDDTTSDHIYLKDDLTKSVGNYTIADHHMVIDLSTLDYGVDSSKSIELDLETTTSHLIFTDSEAKIYFRKATNESPTEVMVSVLQNYANDTKADPNSIIKNTNTDTNTKKSSKQVITMSGVKRANSNVKARAGGTQDISDTINDKAGAGLSGSYRLTGTTRLDQSMSGANAGVRINNDVTIDLNGHKLQLYNGLYFDIKPGGHLTIIDSKADQYRAEEMDTAKDIGNPSVLTTQKQSDDNRNVPSSLDYYVTSATPTASKTGTTDTTKKYHVDFSSAGRIYSETSSTPGQDSTFMIEKGGTLDFKSGVAYNTGPHVLATNGDGNGEAKVNISGGYLIGNKNGTVVFNNAGNTLNISGGVITNGIADNGAGIYNNSAKVGVNSDGTYKYGGTGGGTINLTGGVISGNEIIYDWENVNPGDDLTTNRFSGAGIYMKSGTLNISGNAYITNNSKARGESRQNHYSMHGGGGVAADNDSKVKMSGGYVTGNFSNEAGAGLYIGYYENIAGISQFIMTGGTIASNVTETGEGGGIRIAKMARGSIRADKDSKIYITNNKTNTGEYEVGTGDWGGGGIFVQEKGFLNVMNSVITQNHSDGFGGGVSACPTGSTNIVSDQGTAIYGNTADGTHYSRGSGDSSKGEHKNEDYAAYKWKEQYSGAKYRDYFLAHPANDGSYYSFGNEMLGGGSQRWEGTFNDGKAFEQNFNADGVSANFLMLTANPTPDDINKALESATTFISGNHSGNHGGGIMTNGNLTLGMTKDNYPMITLKSYKSLFVQNGTNQKMQKSISEGKFDFSIYRHDGDNTTLPVWDGYKFTAGSGVNKLINETSNDASTDSEKSALVQFPVYKINDNGTYIYYIVENKDKDKTMDYDTTIYEVDLTVEDHGTTKVDEVETTQHSIKSYQVYKIDGKDKTRISKSQSDFPFNDSKTDNAITIGSSTDTAFTNTKHNYNITITKTDSENESKVLSGAEFRLYKLDDNNADTSITMIDLTDLGEQKTDNEGKISYTGLISNSKYYLVEEKAPEGYNINGPWIIDMSASGMMIYKADCKFSGTKNNNPQLTRNVNNTFVTGTGIKIDDSSNSSNSSDYLISTNVSDTSIKYTMPNTGGKGTYVYYQVGILLITLVNILWIVKRRVV